MKNGKVLVQSMHHCWLQKVQKLQERLHFVGDASQAQHTIFVDDEDELRGYIPTNSTAPSELLDGDLSRQQDSAGQKDKKREAKLQRYRTSHHRNRGFNALNKV